MSKIINTRKTIIFAFLTICWVGIIFSFSLQPAETSSELSGGLGSWLVENFIPSFLDELEVLSQEQLEIFYTLLRKCAHFTEFVILGVLSMLTLLQINLRYRPFWGQAFCVLIASADETIQLFVRGRFGQVTDVLLDSVGAIVGIAIVCLCFCK